MHRFNQLERNMATKGERNDCAVKALAIATRQSYNVAHTALAMHGRDDRAGTYPQQTYAATEMLGFSVREVWNRYDAERGCTVRTVGNKFPKGTYYVHVRGHILALVNGEVEDWTKGQRRDVLRVSKVEQEEKA